MSRPNRTSHGCSTCARLGHRHQLAQRDAESCLGRTSKPRRHPGTARARPRSTRSMTVAAGGASMLTVGHAGRARGVVQQQARRVPRAALGGDPIDRPEDRDHDRQEVRCRGPTGRPCPAATASRRRGCPRANVSPSQCAVAPSQSDVVVTSASQSRTSGSKRLVKNTTEATPVADDGVDQCVAVLAGRARSACRATGACRRVRRASPVVPARPAAQRTRPRRRRRAVRRSRRTRVRRARRRAARTASGRRPHTPTSSAPSVPAMAGACVTRAQCPVPTSPNRMGAPRSSRARSGRVATGIAARSGARRTYTVRPGSSPNCSAVPRVTCAQMSSPSTLRSTRTSKPSRVTRGDRRRRRCSVSRRGEQLEVVRSHQPAAELGDRAEEAHHEVVRRLVVELVGRADLLDLAVGHHHDRVGDLHRLLLVVGDEHRGDVDLVVQAPQPGAQLLAHLRVERAERLVEQQHLRLDRERAGQRHALALAAGELRRVAVGELARGARARAAR